MLRSLKPLDDILIYAPALIARGSSRVTSRRSDVYLSVARNVVVLLKLLLCSPLIRSLNLSWAVRCKIASHQKMLRMSHYWEILQFGAFVDGSPWVKKIVNWMCLSSSCLLWLVYVIHCCLCCCLETSNVWYFIRLEPQFLLWAPCKCDAGYLSSRFWNRVTSDAASVVRRSMSLVINMSVYENVEMRWQSELSWWIIGLW